MTSAEFSINADPYANLGYDTTVGSTLTLQLTGATFDAYSCVYEVVQKSQGAPDIAELGPIGGGGAAATPSPTSPLDITMPGSGVHSYIIRCTINGGQNSATGAVEAEYSKERLVAIKDGSLRKICPAESTQYDGVNGWTGAFNDLVEMLWPIPPGSSSTDDALVRWDGITGDTLQDSVAELDDGNNLSGLASVTIGTAPGTGTIRLSKAPLLTSKNQAGSAMTIFRTLSTDSIRVGQNTTNINDTVVHVGDGRSIDLLVNNVAHLTINKDLVNTRNAVLIGSAPANAGHIRVGNTGSLKGRNTANNANLDMISMSSNRLLVGGNDARQAGVNYLTCLRETHSLRTNNTEKLSVGGGSVRASVPVTKPGYTVANLPTGLSTGSTAYCTNEAGGAVPVYYDGTNWRRWTDTFIVST